MVNCKECFNYNKEYDNMRQSGDDVIVIGKETEDTHYCAIFQNGIDQKIYNNEIRCPYFVQKQ